jgi:hypothetical protein
MIMPPPLPEIRLNVPAEVPPIVLLEVLRAIAPPGCESAGIIAVPLAFGQVNGE